MKIKKKLILLMQLLILSCQLIFAVDEQFFSSCRSGDTVTVKSFLENGVSPHSRDSKGNSCMIIASGRGQIEVIKLLLAYKANPEDVSTMGIFEGKSSIRY